VPSRFPSKLYKYVPAARIDILKNARVRFTPPVVFNDPFEMLPVLTRVIFASDLESHHLKTEQAFNEYVQQAFAEDKTHGETIRAQIGVLSLTAEPGSLLMWAHYADHHRGFAIEFDALHPFFHQRQSKDDEFHHVRRVWYKRNRPCTQIESLLSPPTLLTKSVDWRYEREWRMLADFTRFAHNVVREAGQEIHLVAIPPACITGVILGARMADETRDEVLAFVTNDPRYPHVTVRCAELDPGSFGVILQQGERHLERAKSLMKQAAGEAMEAPTVLLEAAFAELDRALRYNPSSYDCLVVRAGAHTILRNLDTAVCDYGRAIDLAPESAKVDLCILRAQLLVALGREAEAKQNIELAQKTLKSLDAAARDPSHRQPAQKRRSQTKG